MGAARGISNFLFRFSDLAALRASVGRRVSSVATVGIILASITVTSHWWPGITPGVAVVISMCWIAAAAAVDMLCRRLPDAFLALAILPTAMAAAAHVLQGSPSALTGIGYGAVIWSVPLLGAHLVAPDALGFGDVKAAAVVGATLGLVLPVITIAAALVVAMATASIAGVTTRRRKMALGPFLTLGAAASLLVHPLVREGLW